MYASALKFNVVCKLFALDVSGNISFAGKLYYVAFIDQAIIIWLASVRKEKNQQHFFITI